MTIEIQNEDSMVAICPDIGASIARFTWRGRDILRTAPDTAFHDRAARQMGFYPLVPYSNRIGQAELIFGERRFQLRANSPPEAHALHGFGWQRAWQVVSRDDNAVEMMLQHAPDADWPFACEATESIRLLRDELQLRLSVRNTGDTPMPAGLGFHPYFPLDRNTRLQANWTNMWGMTPEMLPTAPAPPLPQADFRVLRIVDGWKVDNCFTGWDQSALLDYRTHRVHITASEDCRQLICFAPNDGRNFIALEPVTNINNAFALAAKGIADTGMRILAPNERFEISMSLRMQTQA